MKTLLPLLILSSCFVTSAHACQTGKSEASCLADFFGFYGSTEYSTVAEAKSFDTTLKASLSESAQMNGDGTSITFDAVFFLAENFGKLATGQYSGALTSITGVGLIQTILASGRDTRPGMFRSSYLFSIDRSFQDKPKSPEIFEAYRDTLGRALTGLSTKQPTYKEFVKKTIFGAEQVNAGFLIEGDLCTDMDISFVDGCFLRSEILSDFRSDREPESGEYKGQEMYYYKEHFLVYTSDRENLASATRRNKAAVKTWDFLDLSIARESEGRFFHFRPKSGSDTVGFFFNGTQTLYLTQ